ncbi:MAG: hypothetical protein JWR63_3072 [Conexibacter sp.]|nr:hypothetical protein [Conexibacter sp.]
MLASRRSGLICVSEPDLFSAMSLGRRFFPRLTKGIVLVTIVCFGGIFQRLFLEAVEVRGARITGLMERAIQLPQSSRRPALQHGSGRSPRMTARQPLGSVVRDRSDR